MERQLLGYQIVGTESGRRGEVLVGSGIESDQYLWELDKIRAAYILSVQNIPSEVVEVWSDGTKNRIELD